MKKTGKKILALWMAAVVASGAAAPAGRAQEYADQAEVYTEYEDTEIMAQSGEDESVRYDADSWTDLGGRGWTDGMISGNGENGVITTGSPYEDRMIFQYMYFNFPSSQPRTIPDETPYLDEVRQAVFQLDDSWNVHGRNRTFSYTFHPGHQLGLDMEEQPELKDYRRWTDYATAEVGVEYSNEKGDWLRKTFVSREDNVTITKIEQSSEGEPINMTLSIDDISSMHQADSGNFSEVQKLKYKKLVPESADYIAQIAHYPSYEGSELKRGGYGGVTRVVCVGGTRERVVLDSTGEGMNVGQEKNPAIRISGAREVYLITQSDRTFDMGTYEEFDAQETWPLLDELVSNTEKVALNPVYQTEGHFDYEKALAPHVKLHAEQFGTVKFTLDGDEEDKELSNEDLIAKQKGDKSRLNHALIERAYYAGRYAQVCCSGISAPRLYGMWIGEWQPGWRGIYTLDANVNIQVSPMNTGNIQDAPLGYLTFFLRNAPDFEKNAEMTYGMHDAIQIPVNSDGDRGIMVEYDIYYPFQYWNAGASWTLLPIYEYWQCYGNQKIPLTDLVDYSTLRSVLCVEDEEYTQEEMEEVLAKGYLDLEEDILLPLLTKQANFWEQLVTPEYYMDRYGNACYTEGKTKLEPGETYMLIPTYSPENNPVGYQSTITANATMDISAARDGLDMVIQMEKAVGREGSAEAIEKWESLKALLPAYKYDNTPEGKGALKEWAMDEYTENNAHRHISHLYAAWPGYETQNDEELAKAARQAVANRNEYNTWDATASHGWIHKALVASRLKDGEGIIEAMKPLMTSDIYFKSMMTDHDTNRRNNTYCTDTSIGTVGVIQEAAVYSNTGEIEIIPSLPEDWSSGSMDGLMARTRAEVEKMSWDLEKGAASVQIRSDIDQTIRLKSGMVWTEAVVSDPSRAEVENSEYVMLHLQEGEVLTVDFYRDPATKSMLAEAVEKASNALSQHPASDPLYHERANEALDREISRAKEVYFHAAATGTEIRESIWNLETAVEAFYREYEYSLTPTIPSGVYGKRKELGLEFSENPRIELRFTLDGSPVTEQSTLYSGSFLLPDGYVPVKAAQFIKGTGELVGEPLDAWYLICGGTNRAEGQKASIDRPVYGNQGAGLAVDGREDTRLAVLGDYEDYTLELEFQEPAPLNYLYLDEYVEAVDQETSRIQSFVLEYQDAEGGEWKSAASFDEDQIQEGCLVERPDPEEGSFHAWYGISFEEVTAKRIRVIFKASKEISIWELELYRQYQETELVTALETARACMMEQEEEYEPESWAELEKAYQEALALLEGGSYAQSDLDTAAKNLRTCIGNLKKKQPETKPGHPADFTVLAPGTQVFTGAALTPPVTVRDQGRELVKDRDYFLKYENNVNAGRARITAEGLGTYRGIKKTVEFVIDPKNAGDLKIWPIGDKKYTGKKLTPVPKVSNGTLFLAANRDFTVTYTRNKAVGTAGLTIHGKGNYTGTKSVSFSIVPKAPAGIKLRKREKGKVSLQWKKVRGADGYLVYRSSKKKSGYKKVKTLKKAGSVQFTAKTPKKGRKYYYYVKSYKKVKGKRYVSGRSKILRG